MSEPMRRWEQGETPPDGWYWFVGAKSLTAIIIQNGKAVTHTRATASIPWYEFKCEVYGPIPEPKVTP